MASGKNSISVAVATAVSLGAIIGAGIFVLSGTAIALAGSYAILAFILVGVVALMIGLQLGELGSLMPTLKGASYSYAYKAFGSEMGFITGIMLFFSYATMASVIALGFGSYLSSMLGLPLSIASIPFAIVLIVVLALVNIMGIRQAARADTVLVVIKMGILLLFAVFGILLAFAHNANPFSNITGGGGSLAGIFAASVVIFFAYAGFQAVSSFVDRVKGGGRGAARAIVYSVLISMVLYTLVSITLILLLPVSSYKITGDPLAFALQGAHAPPWLFLAVDLGALIATASAALASLIYSSRLVYQIGSDGLLPRIARKYNKDKDVAVNGVIITSAIAIIMLFAGNIYIIAAIANVGLFVSFLMVSFALLHFRRTGAKPPFRAPLYPYLPIITIVALLIFFAGLPREALIFGMIIILSLLIVYYSLREVEKKKPVNVVLFR
jgi:APA family basic amino acid/polyamine antiporter